MATPPNRFLGVTARIGHLLILGAPLKVRDSLFCTR